MTKTIWVSDKLRDDWDDFIKFVQQAANRLAFGHPRYEAPRPWGTWRGPKKENRYMSRMEAELKAYKRTGNAEHLRNIFNYAWLETRAPENRKFHWDNTVDSVTRGRKEF